MDYGEVAASTFTSCFAKKNKYITALQSQGGHVLQAHESKIRRQIDKAKSEGVDTRQLSEMYMKFNMLRRAQSMRERVDGPNFLASIMAKAKLRLPDINDQSIRPFNDDVNPRPDYEPPDDCGFSPDQPDYDTMRGTMKPGTTDTIDAVYDSFDYTESSSALQYMWSVRRSPWSILKVNFCRWPIAFSIGVVTALVALLIQISIENLTKTKYQLLSTWFQKTYEESDPVVSFLISVSINILGCGLAAGCCVVAPQAVGSGIPQIKSYLNGINIPKLMRFKTLCAKVLGVILSVSGGLAVGKEGPMIHSGAVIAAGLSQGKATSLPITTKYNKAYRNDQEKRDFVACGAAAGVAAAFGSPLGGLLFAIEEGASHINHSVLWRIAMSSITSFFTLNLVMSVVGGFPGQMSNGGLISFGEFSNAAYNLYEVIIFFTMAAVGGLTGALFNHLNEKLTQFRIRHMNSTLSKVAEVVTCGVVVATVAFMMMSLVDDCKAYDVDINDSPVRLFCQDGKASAAASLWYKTPEETVRSLFHDKPAAHDASTLLLFTVIYFFLACWTYGMFISSGLFVPSLLIGAAWGRLVGMGLISLFPEWDWGDLGKYALIGASAQLAGTIRLTYSLTAILLEATGNLTYIFPVFTTVFIAKLVGDLINEGLYDIHINILGIPLLPYQPPVDMRSVTAKDMMNDEVTALKVRSKVGDVVRALIGTPHNAFPIVDTNPKVLPDNTKSFGRLRGVMRRHDIVTMLQYSIYVENDGFGYRETFEKLRAGYPRFVNFPGCFVVPESYYETKTMDFSNAMDAAPYSAQSAMAMPAVYNLFRNLGLRHLVVVNNDNEVVGMITRTDVAAIKPNITPFPRQKVTLHKKTSTVTWPAKKTLSPRAARRRRAHAGHEGEGDVPYVEI